MSLWLLFEHGLNLLYMLFDAYNLSLGGRPLPLKVCELLL